MPFKRLFVDVSYTRTQTGSVGVTRTVRSLLNEFQKSAPFSGWTCRPVAVHSLGFREVVSMTGGNSKAARGPLVSMLRWLTRGHPRRLALAVLPLSLQQVAWRLYSRWAFDALSRDAPPVVFQAGDVLFMADASWHYDAVPAIQRARQQGARVVLMVHDLIPLRHPEWCAPLVSAVFAKWLMNMLSSVDAAICNSQATESDFKSHVVSTGLRLPPTGHFRLGCDPLSPVGMLPVCARISDFLSKPGASFAAVGSFEPRKNYAWLIEVFEQLWATGHNVKLLIAGRPTADGLELVKAMKQHPEQGNRLLTVFDITDKELDHIYRHARALIFPSLAEGFGLPLVEARTRGCLVIANGLPVFRELADEGVLLYEENSTEQLEALVITHSAGDSRALLAPMPAFTWQDSSQQCLKVMDVILAEQPQSGEPLPPVLPS